MNDPLKYLQALELKRTTAMQSHDLERLEPLLDPMLIYSHSTGAVDTKDSFLDSLRSGFLNYLSVVPSVDHAAEIDALTLIGTGRLETKVEVGGTLKSLDSRYMVVWRRTGESWTLAALQG